MPYSAVTTLSCLLTQPVGMASKCNKDAENVYAPLVMVSIGAQKRTLAGKTVYQNRSIDTSFNPLPFSLDSTFNVYTETRSIRDFETQEYRVKPAMASGCRTEAESKEKHGERDLCRS
jgi:hypothetical protein